MPILVGKPAPIFNANAVVNGEVVHDFSLTRYLGKKHVVFFFYPKDFTFVCPSELHAFQAALPEFESRNTAVVACSTDTEQSHWGWLQVAKDKGGIKGVSYPLVADTNKTISSAYGVLAGDIVPPAHPGAPFTATGDLIAYRGLFLIDQKGIVRHQLVNDLPLGRSIDEAIRMVDSLQFFEKHGEVCPANWSRGKKGMKATNEGVAEYLASS
ncbi:MAG TPA: peroxiredoxin [Opitutaceae bacterium]|nr:peroxiredoxin [Opitutaceae bacterium]HND60475.1 peroxiredoxin [Opitutaceae bacterium]